MFKKIVHWPFRQLGKEHSHPRNRMNGPNKFRVCDDMLYEWCTHTVCVCVLGRRELKSYAGWDMPKTSGCFVSPDERIRNQQASDTRRFGIYPSHACFWSPSQKIYFICSAALFLYWNVCALKGFGPVMDWIYISCKVSMEQSRLELVRPSCQSCSDVQYIQNFSLVTEFRPFSFFLFFSFPLFWGVLFVCWNALMMLNNAQSTLRATRTCMLRVLHTPDDQN